MAVVLIAVLVLAVIVLSLWVIALRADNRAWEEAYGECQETIEKQARLLAEQSALIAKQNQLLGEVAEEIQRAIHAK